MCDFKGLLCFWKGLAFKSGHSISKKPLCSLPKKCTLSENTCTVYPVSQNTTSLAYFTQIIKFSELFTLYLDSKVVIDNSKKIYISALVPDLMTAQIIGFLTFIKLGTRRTHGVNYTWINSNLKDGKQICLV